MQTHVAYPYADPYHVGGLVAAYGPHAVVSSIKLIDLLMNVLPKICIVV